MLENCLSVHPLVMLDQVLERAHMTRSVQVLSSVSIEQEFYKVDVKLCFHIASRKPDLSHFF